MPEYHNMHKMLLSTSALRSLPLRRPRAACGKLHNSCGAVKWSDLWTNHRRSASFIPHTFRIPIQQFCILPTAPVCLVFVAGGTVGVSLKHDGQDGPASK